MVQHALCVLLAVWDVAGLSLVDHGVVAEFLPAMAVLAAQLLGALALMVCLDIVFLPFFTLLGLQFLSFRISSEVLHVVNVRTISSGMPAMQLSII